MNPEQFQRIKTLFEQALDQPPESRATWLHEACGGDAATIAAVQRMLDADAAAGDDGLIEIPNTLLDGAASEPAIHDDAWVGRRYGAYSLVRSLGQGGMGAVFLAERVDGAFRHEAAIKLVRTGWDHAELLDRFRRERQILASLNHPHIARLLDGGASESGEPYLVLEYVQGVPIGDYCDRERLSVAARLKLYLDVCSAVAYAHQRLVVHRDLKPSNILVADDGTVKLLDFGIARLLEADQAITAPRDRMFTIGYAAPEQIRGELPSVSVDIYALGLLLYELLTGQRAYGRTASTPAAYEREVLTAEPMLPSKAANDTTSAAVDRAHCRGLQPSQLAHVLNGDLDAIVMRALRKEPEARYASIAELAEDVGAYLHHRPVKARQGNLRYLASRFMRRHSLAVGLGAFALLSLLIGLGVALWQADRARTQRDLARAEARKSKAVAEYMVEVFSAADPAMVDGAVLTPKDLLAQGARRLGEDNALDPATRSAMSWAIGSAQLGVSEYEAGLAQMQIAVAAAVEAKDVRAEIEARLGLGVAFNKLSRSKEAMAEYDLARSLADGLDEPNPKTDEEIDYFRGIELGQMDRRDEGIVLLQSSYDRRLARLEAGAPETIQVATTLGYYLGGFGRVEEALAVTRPNYEAARANPQLPLRWLKEIVSAHAYIQLLNKDPGAPDLFAEAVTIDERIYGVDHPGTAVSLNNTAYAFSTLGEAKRGAEVMERVIGIRRGMNIKHHQELGYGLLNAASMWRKAGELDTAIKRAREGLAIYAARGELDNRQAQKGLWTLVQALESDGLVTEAYVENKGMLRFTDGSSKEFGGADAALPWVMHARLESRLKRSDRGCSSARRALAVEGAAPASWLEARILLIDCLKTHGFTEEAAKEQHGLDSTDDVKAAISAYSRDLMGSWQ